MSALAKMDTLARTLPVGQEIIHGKRADVVAELRRALKRREIQMVTPLYTEDEINVYAGIQRLKPRPPAWRKPAAIATGVTGGVLAVGGVLGSLAANASTLVGVGVAVGVGAVAVAATRGGGARLVEVLVKVRVR